MSQVTVYLDTLTEEQRRHCENCSTQGRDYPGPIPFPICQLAQLEGSLGRIPRYGEAMQHQIGTSSIPEGCPNGYISFPSREIR